MIGQQYSRGYLNVQASKYYKIPQSERNSPGISSMCTLLCHTRNALRLKRPVVLVPACDLNQGICQIMQREGYIDGYYVDDSIKKIALKLKYKTSKQIPVIKGLKPVSVPSRRVNKDDPVPKCLSGLGTVIVRTEEQGVITDKEARHHGVGGEIVCEIW